jgi:hypothetical protein
MSERSSERPAAYVECLAAQEAAYWEARRQGMNLTDRQIGDLLRVAAPHLASDATVVREAAEFVLVGILVGTGRSLESSEREARLLLDDTIRLALTRESEEEGMATERSWWGPH